MALFLKQRSQRFGACYEKASRAIQYAFLHEISLRISIVIQPISGWNFGYALETTHEDGSKSGHWANFQLKLLNMQREVEQIALP